VNSDWSHYAALWGLYKWEKGIDNRLFDLSRKLRIIRLINSFASKANMMEMGDKLVFQLCICVIQIVRWP
jgi:hypothetical protein